MYIYDEKDNFLSFVFSFSLTSGIGISIACKYSSTKAKRHKINYGIRINYVVKREGDFCQDFV